MTEPRLAPNSNPRTLFNELLIQHRAHTFDGELEQELGQKSPALREIANDFLAIHSGQEREPGKPYASHALLVAIIYFRLFGYDRSTTSDLSSNIECTGITTIAHDFAEDQAQRVIDRYGEFLDQNSASSKLTQAELAIEALSSYFFKKYGISSLDTNLHYLTNPDYDKLAEAILKEDHIENYKEALKLIDTCRSFAKFWYPNLEHDPKLLNPKELKNCLYLGHIMEMAYECPAALKVKFADFYTNGVHLYLEKNEATKSGQTEQMQKKLDGWTLKYAPLVAFFYHYIRSHTDTHPFSEDAKTDKWLLKKLEFAWVHGYEGSLNTLKSTR